MKGDYKENIDGRYDEQSSPECRGPAVSAVVFDAVDGGKTSDQAENHKGKIRLEEIADEDAVQDCVDQRDLDTGQKGEYENTELKRQGKVIGLSVFKKKKIALVFCEDGDNYWRKSVNASYKKGRKDKKHQGIMFMPSALSFDLSDFDPVPDVAKATKFIPHAFHFKSRNDEADDIIAHLIKRYYKKKCVIFSSDKDLWQLTEEGRVVVWDGLMKTFVKQEHDSFSL